MLYPQLNAELDILFIVGDFFDGLLDMNGQAGWTAGCIIAELIALAKEHMFLIRVVRGTFSHDRMQNQFFQIESTPSYIGRDLLVRVFDSISIEHLEELNLDVMYVPDDLPCDDAMSAVREKLDEYQLKRVDIMLNHGYWGHLLPKGIPHEPPNTFHAERFDDLVRGVILNGHVHQPSVYRKVISNGSFERLCHGEEEAKGFFVIYYDTVSGQSTHTFVENIYATVFRTFNCTKWRTEEDVLDEYGAWMTNVLNSDISTSESVFIRIVCDDPLLLQAVLTFTRQNSTKIILTSKKSSRKEDEDSEDIQISVSELPMITEANLPEMIAKFLSSTKGIDIAITDIEGVLHP